MLWGLDRAFSAGIIKAKRRRRGEQTMAQGHDSANDHQPHHDDHQRHGHGHSHTHGMIDPTILSTQRGIWAIKWSFVGLLATALFQVVVVFLSGSVALLADTIHNFGDAATAVPLWIAFLFARFKPTRRFSFGYGRVEDLAGVVIVFIILFSAIVAGYEAVDRLLHPRPVEYLWAVVAASIIGFLGHEGVAVFRIRVGQEIGSAALVADGYHTGVEPGVIEALTHAAMHIPGVQAVTDVRARWIGHHLHAELNVAVPPALSVAEGHHLAKTVHHQLLHHVPFLSRTTIPIDPAAELGEIHHRIAAHAHDGLPVHSH